MASIEGLAAPLSSALGAYGEVRKLLKEFLSEGQPLEMDDEGFRELVRFSHNVVDPERELVLELGKLGSCEHDLRSVAAEMAKLSKPEDTRLALEKDEGFLRRLDEDMSTMETVPHPLTGVQMSMFEINLEELVAAAPKKPTAVAKSLAEMRLNMEKMMGLQHTRNELEKKGLKHNEQRLRDALFVAKREMQAMEQQLTAFEQMGLVVAVKHEAELRRDEALNEFAVAKARIKELEETVAEQKQLEAKLEAKLEKLTQGYRSKNLDLIGTKKANETLVEKLSQRSAELARKDAEFTAQSAEMDEALEVLLPVLPSAAGELVLGDVVKKVAHAVGCLRGVIRLLSQDTPPSEVPPQLLHGHLLSTEAAQVCGVASKVAPQQAAAPIHPSLLAPSSNVRRRSTFRKQRRRSHADEPQPQQQSSVQSPQDNSVVSESSFLANIPRENSTFF